MRAEPIRVGPVAPRRPSLRNLRIPARRWTAVVHPFLFAANFVLFLFAQNVEQQVAAGVVLPPLIAALAATAAVFVFTVIMFRNVDRAGLATAVLVVLFFTYGHVWQLVQRVVDERALLAVWAVLLTLGVVAAWRVRAVTPRLSDALAAMAAALVAMSIVPIIGHQAVNASASQAGSAAAAQGLTPGPDAQPVKRDIYFLVFDRYPAGRTLTEQYGYDNRPFLDALEKRGFYVAADSAANYVKTAFSLAATLNMEYVDIELLRAQGRSDADWGPTYETLKGPLVVPAFLKAQGYRYVHVPTWYQGTLSNELADQTLAYGGASEFASVLYDTTILRASALFGVEAELAARDVMRAHTVFQLARLEELAGAPGPKFVFAHVALPHEPYVFDPEGGYVSEAEARERSHTRKFVDQVQYANRRILGIVDRLLDAPAHERPVIVLTSDEGPYPERFARARDTFMWAEATDEEIQRKYAILNTFYMPGVESSELYPSISPVNTFRVVFNAYFDTDLPLLPDRSFVFVNESHIYDQFDITARLRGGEQPETPVAEYEADPPTEWRIGTTARYSITIHNHGDETWPAHGEDAVALAVTFETSADAAGWGRYQRFPLPRTVEPGESVRMSIDVASPDAGGLYVLRHRVARASGHSERSTAVPVEVTGTADDWRALLRARYDFSAPVEWQPGETDSYEVTVTNLGTTTWRENVRLGIHFGQESDVPDDSWATDQRFDLPAEVPPGGSVTLNVSVTAPQTPGDFRLRHRLVMEDITWFDSIDAVNVQVVPAARGGPPPLLALGVAIALVSGLFAVAYQILKWRGRARRPRGSTR